MEAWTVRCHDRPSKSAPASKRPIRIVASNLRHTERSGRVPDLEFTAARKEPHATRPLSPPLELRPLRTTPRWPARHTRDPPCVRAFDSSERSRERKLLSAKGSR